MPFSPFVFRGQSTAGTGSTIPSGLETLDGYDTIVWVESDVETFVDAGTSATTIGDNVYRWDDQTEYLNHAEQTTLLDRPITKTGDTTWGGVDLIEFNGSSGDYFTIDDDASFSSLTEFTVFVMLEDNNTSLKGVNETIAQYSNDGINGGQSDGWTIDYQQGIGAVDQIRFVYDDNVATPSGYNELSFDVDYSTPTLYTFRVSGNTIDAWSGNSSPTPIWTSSNGDGMDTPAGGQPMTIGANFNGTSAFPMDMGTFIMYGGPLSNSAITQVQDYIIDTKFAGGGSPAAPAGSMILDLDPSKEAWTDDGVTIATNGQDLYRWGDQSGSNNDAYCLTGATYSGLTRPAWFESGVNGRPYVHFDNFDGAQAPFYDEFMVVPNDGTFDTQNFTMIAVLNPYRTSPSVGYVYSNNCGAGDGVNNRGWSMEYTNNNGGTWDSNMQSIAPLAGSNYNNEPAYSGGTTHILVQRFSAGTPGQHFVQVNNETKLSGSTVSSINFGSVSDVVINGRFNDSADCSEPNVSLGFFLYRMVMYDEYLDDTTINNFISDLNDYHALY